MLAKAAILFFFCIEVTICKQTTEKNIKMSSKSETYCSVVISKHLPSENLSTLVINEEFPYMAAINKKNPITSEDKWACSGILITDKFVLTNAHCLENNNPDVVRLGDSYLESDTDDANVQLIKIFKIINHPKYIAKKKYHDLALIELKQPAVFTKNVRPACLETKRQPFYYNPILVSYGFVSKSGPKNQLQTHAFYEYDSITCGKYFTRLEGLEEGIIYDSQICAGPLIEPKNFCQVDNGSPLLKLNKKYGHKVVGLASFGKCGDGALPSVFNSIANSISWIESVVFP